MPGWGLSVTVLWCRMLDMPCASFMRHKSCVWLIHHTAGQGGGLTPRQPPPANTHMFGTLGCAFLKILCPCSGVLPLQSMHDVPQDRPMPERRPGGFSSTQPSTLIPTPPHLRPGLPSALSEQQQQGPALGHRYEISTNLLNVLRLCWQGKCSQLSAGLCHRGSPWSPIPRAVPDLTPSRPWALMELQQPGVLPTEDGLPGRCGCERPTPQPPDSALPACMCKSSLFTENRPR